MERKLGKTRVKTRQHGGKTEPHSRRRTSRRSREWGRRPRAGRGRWRTAARPEWPAWPPRAAAIPPGTAAAPSSRAGTPRCRRRPPKHNFHTSLSVHERTLGNTDYSSPTVHSFKTLGCFRIVARLNEAFPVHSMQKWHSLHCYLRGNLVVECSIRWLISETSQSVS